MEMNSYLYWCKKKMTLKDTDAFLKSEGAAVLERLKEVESKPVLPIGSAQVAGTRRRICARQ